MADRESDGPQRIRPLQALKAVRKVVRDPEQTQEVFKVLHALSGPSLRRNYKRFKSSDVGKRVLAERRDLVSVLNDSEYLKNLPSESLGNVYHRFITKEQISAGGLEEASAQAGYEDSDDSFGLFVKRIRATHDLLHVLTQYGRDPLGEACLLAYTYGQTGNISFVFILLYASLDLYLGAGVAVFPALWRAYRDGKRATWSLGLDWEAVLERPLDNLRDEMTIRAPVRYERLYAELAQTG